MKMLLKPSFIRRQVQCPKLLLQQSMNHFAKKNTQTLSVLYEKMKNGEEEYSNKSPLEIIYQESANIDLPSYDILFGRFINADWGKSMPKNPVHISQKTIEFMSATKDLKIALTKEQLCKLIDFYQKLLQVTPPYQRIEAVYIVAQLEQSTAKVIQTPYIDELHTFYEEEFKVIREKLLHIQSPKAMLQIGKALKTSRYYDAKMMQQLCFVYKMLTNFDMEVPNVKGLYEISEIIALLSFFNQNNQDFWSIFLKQTMQLLQNDLPSDVGQLVKLKFIMIRLLRHLMLFPDQCDDEKIQQILTKVAKFLLQDCKKLNVQVNLEDINQLYQSFILFEDKLEGVVPKEVYDNLRRIWEQSNKETLVTFFEQDVLDNIKKLPLKYSKNLADSKSGIEIDIIVNEYKGEKLKKKLAVEVNGVFHYSRNSEEQLGRDKIKEKILMKLGYQIIVIPYFHWYILEEKQKPQFLKDVIENALL